MGNEGFLHRRPGFPFSTENNHRTKRVRRLRLGFFFLPVVFNIEYNEDFLLEYIVPVNKSQKSNAK